MKLKKVHNVLAFDQEDLMEPYIYPAQHKASKGSHIGLRKELLQADEQLNSSPKQWKTSEIEPL